MGSPFSPKGTRALIQDRARENGIRELLRRREGFNDVTFIGIRDEPGRVCAMFTVPALTGPCPNTIFVYPDGDHEMVYGTFAAEPDEAPLT